MAAGQSSYRYSIREWIRTIRVRRDAKLSHIVKLTHTTFQTCINDGIEHLFIDREDFVCIKDEEGNIVTRETFEELADNALLIFQTRSGGNHPQVQFDNLFVEAPSGAIKAVEKDIDKYRTQVMREAEEFNGSIDSLTREADPVWFKGVPAKHSTKSQFMQNIAKGRIRNYIKKARKKLESSIKSNTLLDGVFGKWAAQLNNGDQQHYFSREHAGQGAFCDSDGWFKCGGRYDETKCDQAEGPMNSQEVPHRINPYRSVGERSFFCHWILDHKVEREKIVARVEEMFNKGLTHADVPEEWNRLYRMLCTRENFKLVDKRCDVPTEHIGCSLDDLPPLKKRRIN